MSEGDSPHLRPQVIKRGDDYALINVELDGLTELQRLGVAVLIWDQVRMLMEANGTYRPRDPSVLGSNGIGTTKDIDKVVVALVGIRVTTLSRVRPRLLEQPNVVEDLLEGKYKHYIELRRQLGMVTKRTFAEGGESKAARVDSYFGLSDKFELAALPFQSYLRAWRKKDFRYTHLNPKEAQKRVKIIDEVMADLTAAREDLANRSHVATYRVPSERRENR